jgi:hypothetical protein
MAVAVRPLSLSQLPAPLLSRPVLVPGSMSRRIWICAAALLALVAVAAPALADKTTVKDEKEETAALAENGRVDIVRASAGHSGRLLEHKVVMRERIKRKKNRERPLLGINLRGDSSSDPEYLILGEAIYKNPPKGKPTRIAGAKLTGSRKTWTYRFDPADFPKGGLGTYGWAAFTTTPKALDVVPANSYEIHRP